MLLAPSEAAAKSAPKMVQDMEKKLWSVIVPLNIKAKGESAAVVVPVQIVVVGAVGG